jgi:glycosyltransferase involved in cell wall biosynthesis
VPRVGILIPSVELGGATRTTCLLARELAADGWTVDLIVPRDGTPLVPVLPGVRIVELGARRMVSAPWSLHRYVRRNRPDVLLTNLIAGNVAGLVLRRLLRWPVRIVAVEHTTVSQLARTSPRRRFRLFPLIVGRTYPWADAVVAVSDGVARDLRGLAAPRDMRVEVVPNALDAAALTAQAGDDPHEPWLANGGPPVYLAVGRLAPEKDFPTLLRAFAELRGRRPARLVVLGEGVERDRLEALVAELGIGEDVRLPGARPNPFGHMDRCAALVLSSNVEGSPGVLAEALTLRCRIVATDCPSGPRELLEGGRLGRLVPVADASALAAAMEAALDDPAPALAPGVRAAMAPAAVAQRYAALLREAVAA